MEIQEVVFTLPLNTIMQIFLCNPDVLQNINNTITFEGNTELLTNNNNDDNDRLT